MGKWRVGIAAGRPRTTSRGDIAHTHTYTRTILLFEPSCCKFPDGWDKTVYPGRTGRETWASSASVELNCSLLQAISQRFACCCPGGCLVCLVVFGSQNTSLVQFISVKKKNSQGRRWHGRILLWRLALGVLSRTP